jgi:hypothetical protein
MMAEVTMTETCSWFKQNTIIVVLWLLCSHVLVALCYKSQRVWRSLKQFQHATETEERILQYESPPRKTAVFFTSSGRNRNWSIVMCSSSIQIWWQETMRTYQMSCARSAQYDTSTVRRCLQSRMFVSKHLSAAQIFTKTNRDSYRPTTTTAIEIRRFF